MEALSKSRQEYLTKFLEHPKQQIFFLQSVASQAIKKASNCITV